MSPPSVFTSPAVDWSLASAVAGRFAPEGPRISSRDAHDAVAEIKEHAQQSQEHVRDVTGLIAHDDHRVVVVDRRMWIDSNLRALDSILDMWPASKERLEESSTVTRAIGPRVMAVQLGAALGWLSGKILGQYEALADPGRLLLVAPSIVQVERSLDVDSRDFRLWVCLHEETHRVQFGAVPWLKGHFTGLVMKALDAFDETTPADRLGAVLTEVLAAVGQRRTPDLMFALQSAEQRAVVEEITAFMSLLEGHADVVMDEVGPRVIPSVDVIRERFEARRSSESGVGRPGQCADAWRDPRTIAMARSNARCCGVTHVSPEAQRLRRAVVDCIEPAPVIVGCSGGPDSLALVASAAWALPSVGHEVHVVIVDHGLQADSARVAHNAGDVVRQWGIDNVVIERVQVGTQGGPEAAARTARRAALVDVASQRGINQILLAHTREDQAETVLLRLARGSGARSIASMTPCDPPWYRPFLDVPRDVVHRVASSLACASERQ